jgi:PAS domain S-box-containing protein
VSAPILPSFAELVELINVAHDAILVRDLEGRIDYWNRGAAVLYGWSPEEAIGRISHELLRTRFPIPLADIDQTLRTIGAWEGELSHRTASGDEAIVASRWVLRPGAARSDMVMEINRDITSARHVEDALRTSELALSELFSNATDLIQVSDPDGTIRFANRAWRDTLGFRESDFGRLSVLDVVHPDERTAWQAVTQNALGGAAARIETRFLTRDRREIPVEGTLGARFAEGTPVAVHGFFRDIKGRRQMEAQQQRLLDAERVARQALELQNERLRELDTLKDEFLSLVSHELRTPLATMSGFLDLMLEDVASESPAARRLTIVDRNARRLRRLVDDLLLVAQIDADRLLLQFKLTDIARVVVEAVESAQPAAAAADVTLQSEISRRSLDAIVDEARIAQLLDNLISNAIKFTPAGGQITVSCRGHRGTFELAVADTGIGIDSLDQTRVFDRFFRAPEAREEAIAGCGLGLTIARAIAERHSGRISITSRPGVGSTFTVKLPKTPEETPRDGSSGSTT